MKKHTHCLILASLFWGVITAGFAATATTTAKVFSMHDYFITHKKNNYLSAEAGQMTFTSGSGTIRFLQAFFYSDGACSTLLGEAAVVDNTTGFSFSSSATISFNDSSFYQLANNQGITTASINCMQVFINGGNESPEGVSCQTFDDFTCSGTTCTSSQNKNVSWAASPTFCAARYAYITNSGDDTLSKCDVSDEDGSLSSCASTGSGFSSPSGVALSNGHAYVSNNDVDTLALRTVTASDGSLSGSGTTGSSFSTPSGITINAGYAYVANSTEVIKCTIKNTTGTPPAGSLSSCAATASGVTSPSGIAINKGYAYIANILDNSVYQCTVNTSTGALSSCATTGSGFTFPNNIIVNNNFAYVSNPTQNTVTKCTVNPSTGALSSCASTGSGFTFPNGLAISSGHAYIVNNTGSETVSECDVDASTGAFSNCSIDESGFSNPIGIAIF